MRHIFDRIPLFWKYLMMSLLIFVAFYLSFYFFTNRILVILKEALLIEVPLGILKMILFGFLYGPLYLACFY